MTLPFDAPPAPPTRHQPGVLDAVPADARYLGLALKAGASRTSITHCLQALGGWADGRRCVVGLGEPLLIALGRSLPGLTAFAAPEGSRVGLPATQLALWLWLRGDDAGELLHRARAAQALLAQAFDLDDSVPAFCHAGGRDLTGYEDGTENPEGDAALAAALCRDGGDGLAGSSYVAVQRWEHNFEAFDAMGSIMQDASIGRRRVDNVELDDAPESAHVRRTAQEDFAPEAFVLRRSMPWIDADRAGLMFVAFGASLAAFEAQLRRMSGAEDGVVDALFRFTRPVSGAYYWCPPVQAGQLDLRALGLERQASAD
jgi:putative iron-dependent peroxidase